MSSLKRVLGHRRTSASRPSRMTEYSRRLLRRTSHSGRPVCSGTHDGKQENPRPADAAIRVNGRHTRRLNDQWPAAGASAAQDCSDFPPFK